MAVFYLLSERQKKALFDRGETIELALPHPPVEDRDWLGWARSALPRDVRRLVRSAEPATVLIRPHLSGGRDNLTMLIGQIVDNADGKFCYEVNIIAVTLAPDAPRGRQLPLQWPVNAVVGGEPLLGEMAARPAPHATGGG